MELVIVRHGRTAANASGRLLGRLDVELDEVGREQAELLAAAVGPVDLVVSSPLARTRQTAAAFERAWDCPVETDERWLELDYGSFDGVPLAEVPPAVWRAWRADLDFSPPGGESLRALGARVRAAADDLSGRPGNETVVVVTHVSPIKAAVSWALGVGDEAAWRMYVAPASITRIEAGERGAVLRTFNEVAHL